MMYLVSVWRTFLLYNVRRSTVRFDLNTQAPCHVNLDALCVEVIAQDLLVHKAIVIFTGGVLRAIERDRSPAIGSIEDEIFLHDFVAFEDG